MLLALALLSIVGLVAGAALSFALPVTGLFAIDRARAGIAADTGASLEAAAALADEGDPAVFAIGALANTLLHVEHAGGAAERRRAEALLKTTLGFVKNAPEALYARAVLKRLAAGNGAGSSAEDASLDDDIAKRAEEKSKNPWWQLARATRAFDAGKPDEAMPFLQKAALGDGAPRHAQLVLARHALARGETGDARALTDRVLRASPEHGPARMVSVLAAVVEDARDDSPEERAIKLKKLKQKAGGAKRRDGPPRPGEVNRNDDGEPSLALWRTPQEEQAIEHLEAMDERDGALLALVLQALAAGRGDDELSAEMRARVVAAAQHLPALAARQAELSLLEGDLATAEELLGPALERSPGDVELHLHQARLRALKLVPEEELRKRAAAGRRLALDGVVLPLGKLTFDALAVGPPWRAVFEADAVPDAELVTLLRGGGADMSKKLEIAIHLFEGQRALARGDIAGASGAAAKAREISSVEPDVLLLDARIRLRQGDRDAAKQSIDAAVASAGDDPHVLLVAARLHYDNEGYIPARKVLKKLEAAGFKSPTALALEAMLEARSGDPRSAARALAEAQRMGAESVELLGASVLILRDGREGARDLDAARAAADRLFSVDQLRTSDVILRAWQAEAAYRAGDVTRAEAVIDDVLAARPNLAEAHLFRGVILSATRREEAMVSFGEAIRLAAQSPIGADALKRRTALGGAPVEAPAPRVKGKLLPRKRPR